MSRRRKGEPIDGWIILDKSEGISSAAAVALVRRSLNAAKAGHGGTLDPLATGILPIALGEATKTVSFVMDGAKTYRFTIAWGEARATDDREGEVTATSPVRPERQAILAALPGFTGEIEQVPPAFSAIKVAGKRAYTLARAGAEVTLAARKVTVNRLELHNNSPESASFELVCGKGTYVRSLARDLASALGTLGYVATLRRTRCGPFGLEQAISLDKLDRFGHSAASFVLPVATALDDIPALAVTEDEASRLRNGQSVPVNEPATRSVAPTSASDQTVRVMAGGRLVALGRVADGVVRPLRVLHL